MPSRTLPGLGLNGFWDLGEDGWKGGMDSNLLVLSAVARGWAKSRATSLPGVGTAGDVYLVPSGDANGNKIAVWDGAAGSEAWAYVDPRVGMKFWIEDEDKLYVYFDGAWTEFTVAANAPANLNEIGDVNVGTPGSAQDGFLLTWDDATSRFILAETPITVLNDLDDVTVVASVQNDNKVLTYDHANTRLTLEAIPAQALQSLSDVSMTPGAGVDGYAVVYDDASGNFILAEMTGGGGSLALPDLTDVSFTGTPNEGDVLKHDGTNWVFGISPGLEAGAPPEKLHWRLAGMNSNAALNEVALNYVEMMISGDSTNYASNQTGGAENATASSQLSFNSPTYAQSSSTAVHWISEQNGSDHWWAVEMGAARSIVTLAIRPQSGATGTTRGPTSVTVQYSDDGVTWVDYVLIDNIVWVDGVRQEWDLTKQQSLSSGGGGGGVSNLVDLTDVNITPALASDGYSVTYDHTSGKFVLTDVSGGGGGGATSLAGLSDVDLTGAVTGQVLTKDAGGNWIAAAVGDAPGSAAIETTAGFSVDRGTMDATNNNDVLAYDHSAGAFIRKQMEAVAFALAGGAEVLVDHDIASSGTLNSWFTDTSHNLLAYDEIRVFGLGLDAIVRIAVSANEGSTVANIHRIYQPLGTFTGTSTANNDDIYIYVQSTPPQSNTFGVARIEHHATAGVPTTLESFSAQVGDNDEGAVYHAVSTAVEVHDGLLIDTGPNTAGRIIILGIKKSVQPLELDVSNVKGSAFSNAEVLGRKVTGGLKVKAGTAGKVYVSPAANANAQFDIKDAGGTVRGSGTVALGATEADITFASEHTFTGRVDFVAPATADSAITEAHIVIRGETV